MKRCVSPVVLLVILVGLAVSSVASADAKTYPDVKIQISFPDGWQIKDVTSGITMVGAPADDAGLIVFPVKDPTPAGVKKVVNDLVSNMQATNVVWNEKLEQDTANGLPLYARSGTATFGGKPHDLFCFLALYGNGALVLLGVVQHDRKDAYDGVLKGTVKSIAPIK